MNNIPTAEELLEVAAKPRNIKSFDDAMTAFNYWHRSLTLCEINEDVGECIENMIRFWNAYDEENGILEEDRIPIKIYIDSPGGSLLASFTIIDSIKMSKTPVWTINIGTAYSGGFFIFINGHKRFCYQHSSFLYHEGATEVGGDAGKFQNFAAFYKTQLAELKNIVLNCTKITSEFYEEIRRDDFWMDADKAIELGVADEIIKEFV